MPRNRWQRGRIPGTAGVDFVTCRICGDRRRVINSQHLSKHDTDRLTYMEEYELGPDRLVAKAFRVLHSSRSAFKPNGKAEWVAEIKSIYKKNGLAGLRRLQKKHKYLYEQALWLFGGIDEGFRFIVLNPEEIRLYGSWEDERLHREIWNLRRQKLRLYPYYVMKHHQKVFVARAGRTRLVVEGLDCPWNQAAWKTIPAPSARTATKRD